MGIRPFFGIQTLGTPPQPLMGTTLTAAVIPTPDPYTGKTGPGNNQSMTTIPVTSSVGFKKDDVVLVMLAGSTTPDQGTIYSVPNSTSVVVQGLLNPHASGEWLILAETACDIKVQIPSTNSGVLYLGKDNTVAVGSATLFYVLPVTAGAVYDSTSTTTLNNPFNTSEIWVLGTSGDKYLASFTRA